MAFLPDEQRLRRVVGTLALATKSISDYLTEVMLSNHYFGDDIQMIGSFEDGEGRKLLFAAELRTGFVPRIQAAVNQR